MAAETARHRAAVLGSPIAHSLSPRLHTAGYRAAGLDTWSYQAIEMTVSELPGFVSGLDATWAGLSLTMPLKEAAFPLATEVSAAAARSGAINTLVRRRDGGWDADNTDIGGIVAALAEVDHGGRARVMGAGATARSAVLALADLGVREIEVAARRIEAADALAAFATARDLSATCVPLAAWADEPPPLLVSTLPAAAGAAMTSWVPSDLGFVDVTLFDVVYAPWPSPMAAAVMGGGGAAISGLEMLIHQGAAQFEIFTGRVASLEALRAAVASSR